MKVIEIKLVIPYKNDFSLPAFTGTIEGYTGIRILKAGQVISESIGVEKIAVKQDRANIRKVALRYPGKTVEQIIDLIEVNET